MMYILPTVVEFVHATVCFVQCTLYTVSKHSYSSSVFIFGNFDDLFFWFLEPFTQRIKLHIYTCTYFGIGTIFFESEKPDFSDLPTCKRTGAAPYKTESSDVRSSAAKILMLSNRFLLSVVPE